MTLEEARKLLGLDGSTDLSAARRAYLRAIKQHPPERDPEGFQKVRAAYELVQKAGAARPQTPDALATPPVQPPVPDPLQQALSELVSLPEQPSSFVDALQQELERVAGQIDPALYDAIAQALTLGDPAVADALLGDTSKHIAATRHAARILSAQAPGLYALYECVLPPLPVPLRERWRRMSVWNLVWSLPFTAAVIALTMLLLFPPDGAHNGPMIDMRPRSDGAPGASLTCTPEGSAICLAARRLVRARDCFERVEVDARFFQLLQQSQRARRLTPAAQAVGAYLHAETLQMCPRGAP